MLILVISTIGYVGYVVIADIFGVSGTDALFFQSIGMAIGGFLLSMKHETNIKSTALNLIPVLYGRLVTYLCSIHNLKLVLQQVSHYHNYS